LLAIKSNKKDSNNKDSRNDFSNISGILNEKISQILDINIISIGDLFDRIVIFVSCQKNKIKWG
jgi:hypothetical protein